MKKNILFVLLCLSLIALIFMPVFSQTADDYFNKANKMLISGNQNLAVENYQKAIKQNPSFSEAYLGLGMAYNELGKYQEALDSTETAIKLNPGYYQAFYNMGLIYEKQNKDKEALEAYERFLKELPGAGKFSDVKQRISKLKKS